MTRRPANITAWPWVRNYRKANEHNALVPRDHWLEDWEKTAILEFEQRHPLEGDRRLAFMMLDADIVAVSPASVYRLLRQAGRLQRWNRKPSRKGTGFVQPLRPHEHGHVDVSYLNVGGTFYYLCIFLDGASRYVVHWDIRARMTEAEVEIIVQRAREKFPGVAVRIISDNGPQFIARDFKAFIRISGMTHVRTSPYYPQSNGKIERWHKSLKSECVPPGAPLCPDDARRLVTRYVAHYNTAHLHSAIGYVAPADKLARREALIFAERDQKLEAARRRRQLQRADSGSVFGLWAIAHMRAGNAESGDRIRTDGVQFGKRTTTSCRNQQSACDYGSLQSTRHFHNRAHS